MSRTRYWLAAINGGFTGAGVTIAVFAFAAHQTAAGIAASGVAVAGVFCLAAWSITLPGGMR